MASAGHLQWLWLESFRGDVKAQCLVDGVLREVCIRQAAPLWPRAAWEREYRELAWPGTLTQMTLADLADHLSTSSLPQTSVSGASPNPFSPKEMERKTDHIQEIKRYMTWRPSTVTHTWNLPSVFNPSKLVHMKTHTANRGHTQEQWAAIHCGVKGAIGG